MAKTGEVVMARPSDIYIGDRRRTEMGDVHDLAADIRENGLINPITVRPPNEVERELGVEQPYILIAGGRRTGAVMLLGWHEVPVYVRESMDELKHRIIELHENVKRKQMTWDEEALAMQEIVQIRQAMAEAKGEKITQAEIAIELQIDKGTLTRNMQAAEALQAQPELKKSSSRKAALRVREVVKHHERLTAKEAMTEQQSTSLLALRNWVVTGDAREFVRKVPSDSVDLVLTDPPYGMDYFKTGHKMRAGGKDARIGSSEFDDTEEQALDLITDLVPQWFRVLRETGWLCVFMNETNYEFLRDAVATCCVTHLDYQSEAEDEFRCREAIESKSPNACRYLEPHPIPWIWFRTNSRNRPRYPEKYAQNMYEKMLVCNMGKGQLTGPCGNVLEFEAEYGDERIHVHQKPLNLAKELTKRFTMIGDTVLDTTFGSGRLLAGAASLGRYVMGSELNPDMREPAIAIINKYMISPPSTGKKISEERHLKAAAAPAMHVEYEEIFEEAV
jgi:site-specific DNA-methyltransferase (adenine-specific)